MQGEEERAGQQSVTPPPEAPGTHEEGVGTWRKARLAVLVAVLAALTIAAFRYRRRSELQESRRRERVAAALAELRQALAGIDQDAPGPVLRARIAEAVARYHAVDQLDPGNEQAVRLGVALSYAQGTGLDDAVRMFNALDVNRIAAEIDQDALARARDALEEFPQLTADAAATQIHSRGRDYLQGTGFLWGAARVIVPAAGTERDRFMGLLRWMALHLAPARPGDAPADPQMAVFRGYVAPAEAAWTYCELARQADLRCRAAAVPPAGGTGAELYVVQAEPTDGEPFLIDPYGGVPLLDPASGELLALDALKTRPQVHAALLALAGEEGGTGHAFGSAELRTALHPFACFRRFLAFDHLLGALPDRPRVGAHPELLTQGRPLRLWEVPLTILQEAASIRLSPAAQRTQTALQMLQRPRVEAIQGHHRSALAGFTALLTELRANRQSAEMAEGAALLDEAIEHAAFFAASAAFDAGLVQRAADELRAYLDAYPQGRWRAPAAAQLAECLHALGDPAAEQAWRDLPEERRLYGALRERGLLAGPRSGIDLPPEGP